MTSLWMRNPGQLPDNPPVPVTELAYESHWRHHGWELVDTPAEHSELAKPDDSPAPASVQEPAAPDPAPTAVPDTDSDPGAKAAGKQGRK
jgi:hypothetical protein